MNFDALADELHQQEFARLAAAVTPRPEALRSMTPDALHDEIAMMWERLGHTVITNPSASEIVTIKGERKFITMCANPTDLAPTGSGAIQRLRDRVVAVSAERGFYVTARNFTAEAQHFAATAPVQLIDFDRVLKDHPASPVPPAPPAEAQEQPDGTQNHEADPRHRLPFAG